MTRFAALYDFATPQSYENRVSRDPVFYFVLLAFFAANFLLAIYLTVHDWPAHARSHAWSVLLAMAFLLLTFTVRRYAAKNQERIIRWKNVCVLLPCSPRLMQRLPRR